MSRQQLDDNGISSHVGPSQAAMKVISGIASAPKELVEAFFLRRFTTQVPLVDLESPNLGAKGCFACVGDYAYNSKGKLTNGICTNCGSNWKTPSV